MCERQVDENDPANRHAREVAPKPQNTVLRKVYLPNITV